MEEVRGSNPLSSTDYPPLSGQNNITAILLGCLLLSDRGA